MSGAKSSQWTLSRTPTTSSGRARFDQLLQANGLSETEFLHLMQAQIIRNQLLDSIRAAATAPSVMVKAVYAFENQTRIAQLVQLPFAAAAAPPPPPPTPCCSAGTRTTPQSSARPSIAASRW